MAYKLKENMLYNTAYQVLSLFVPLITTPYVSRVLGPTGVGEYSFTFSIVSLATTFAVLGGDAHGNRCIAQSGNNVYERSKNFWGIFIVQAISTLAASTVYFLYSFSQEMYTIFLLWQGIHLVASLCNVNWVFYGLGQFKYMVQRNIVIKLITLVCIFIFVRTSDDVVPYIAILSICDALSAIVVWPKMLKNVKFVKVHTAEILKHIKPMLLLFTSVLAMSLYKKMDKVMIGMFSTVTQNGYYENVDKILQLPTSVISAFVLVMLHQISNMIAINKQNESIELTNRMIKFVIILSCAMCTGIYVVSEELVPVFFGNQFLDCIPIMKLLCIVIILQAISNMVRSAFLIPYKFDNIYVKSTVAGAVVNFVLNLIFIKYCGAIGAAIGTIGAEFTVTITQLFCIKSKLPVKRYLIQTMEYFGCSVLMGVIILVFRQLLTCNNLTKLILEVLVGVFTYSVVIIFYMIEIKKDQDIIMIIKKLPFFNKTK